MNFDWESLGFGYIKTDCNIRCYYKNGAWGDLEVHTDEYVPIHAMATCLHYGQESFEGLKAYRGKDNKIRLFRHTDNAKRMLESARGIMLAEVPESLFMEAVEKAVKMNEKYVPPYGSGATLYIRPILIGSGPQVGVKPADEYLFMVYVMPVGPYFKEGFKPLDIMICRDHDRAAPLGTGHLKVGGNYAASLTSIALAREKGFGSTMYLDAKEKKYIDECGPANFFGIRDNTYITPDSNSILPSITNKSLITLAEDLGMKVEKRPVSIEELAEFEEAGACGTAAVITPIKSVVDEEMGITYSFGDGKNPGEITKKLYETLVRIQFGDLEDKFGWITILD